MDCFRCSKVCFVSPSPPPGRRQARWELTSPRLRPSPLQCQERVVADTNLLLLSDGNPVCSNCSYQVSDRSRHAREEA